MLKYIPYFSNSFWLRTFLHFTIVHTFLLNSNCKNVFPPASDSQPFSEFNLGLTISLEEKKKKSSYEGECKGILVSSITVC